MFIAIQLDRWEMPRLLVTSLAIEACDGRLASKYRLLTRRYTLRTFVTRWFWKHSVTKQQLEKALASVKHPKKAQILVILVAFQYKSRLLELCKA